jgi:uncharacterized membrane protein YqjE
MQALLLAFRSALSLLLTRAEFANVELSLARAQVMRWLLLALGASVLAMLGLMALSAMIALMLWDRFGWISLGVLAIVYSGAGALLVLHILNEVAKAPPLLAQTFDELAKDREAVFGSAEPAGEGPNEP